MRLVFDTKEIKKKMKKAFTIGFKESERREFGGYLVHLKEKIENLNERVERLEWAKTKNAGYLIQLNERIERLEYSEKHTLEKQVLKANKAIGQSGLTHEELSVGTPIVDDAPKTQRTTQGRKTQSAWTKKEDKFLKFFLKEHPNWTQKNIAIELVKKEFPKRTVQSVRCRASQVKNGNLKGKRYAIKRHVWSDEENLRLWNITQREDCGSSNKYFKQFCKEFQGRSADAIRVRAGEMLRGNWLSN